MSESTTPVLEPISTNNDNKDDDGLKHIVCCHDKDLTLCGKVSKNTRTYTIDEINPAEACVVCVPLWYETKECPLFGFCNLR